MNNRFVSKRNPLIPLTIFALIGIALLVDHRTTVDGEAALSAEKPLVRNKQAHHAQLGALHLAEEPGAPEAHAFGLELLDMGLWNQAEPVLLGACETGDLTSCQALGDEYAKLGRDAEADARFAVACVGGQLQGCRSLLDRPTAAAEKRMAAASRLEQICIDHENGSACQLLAESFWSKSNPVLLRRYLGLACSRGIESSCPRAIAANLKEGG